MYYDIKASGNRIKRLRIDRNLSQEIVSEKIGISIDGYRKIERGVNGAKVDTLICIADYYGVSLDFIVTGKEPRCESDVMLKGRTAKEKKFIGYIVNDIIKNIELIKE